MEENPLVQIGVAGALTRELQQDHAQFVQYFANALSSAFPSQAELLFEGGFLRKKELVGVSIRLGDNLYAIRKGARTSLSATKSHFVRGISLKTEDLPVDQWLAEISAELERHVEGNSSSRDALARALGI